MTEPLPPIAWDDFARVDLRIGTVVAAEAFPEARQPAYKVIVDFGPPLGTRRTSAQVTALYAAEELVGRQVVGVVNLPPKQIGPVRSEFLLVGVYREGGEVVLIGPDSATPNGARLA